MWKWNSWLVRTEGILSMVADESHDDKTQSFTALTSGTAVLHYKILEKIGSGGMGEVYLALDTGLNRKVALKFLPPHLCQDEDCRKRFTREAQTAAGLDHPNIAAIYEVGEFQGRPFYTMQVIEGQSLKEVITGKDLPFDRILEICIQVCEGLQAAHDKGIIHRDIKPSNILLDSHGRVRIVDFGLAAIRGSEHLTKTGSTLGTIGYMSPEQVQGKEIDQRSDLFSFGVVLYELITKQNPFKRDSEAATLKAVSDDDIPEPLARFKSGIPDGLQSIIDKALEKDAKTRYQHADGMLSDLVRIKQSLVSGQSNKSGPSPTPRSARTWWIAGASLVIAAGIVLVSLQPWHQSHIADAIPMIAVLPFDNLGLPEDEYFADGMTEEITSRLAGIQGLGVISRTSAIKYKDSNKKLSEIGKELGVAYILEGTVRWTKDVEHSRVRITPQLIRVSDDRHLWADNYERELMQIFAVQADIAEQIVEQMGITLLEKDKTTLANIPTNNAEAYQLYLRAMNSFRRDEGDSDPLKDLDSAIVLDPTFALAYALRSEAYSQSSYNQPNTENARIALESAKKSLEIQPGLPQGHLALGYYYHYVETDYDRAMEQFSLAEPRLKNDQTLLYAMAFVYARQGNMDQAIIYSRKLVDLDPLNVWRYHTLWGYLMYARKYDEAVQAMNRAIALDPDEPEHYHRKIGALESWYGEVDSIMPVAIEALKHCDTMEFAKLAWTRSRYSSILPWDSLATEYAREVLEKDTVDYSKLYLLYRGLGNSELTAAYADKAREYYKGNYEKAPDNPFYPSNYGLLLSFLGECDTAIALGLRAKELMSAEECFW